MLGSWKQRQWGQIFFLLNHRMVVSGVNIYIKSFETVKQYKLINLGLSLTLNDLPLSEVGSKSPHHWRAMCPYIFLWFKTDLKQQNPPPGVSPRCCLLPDVSLLWLPPHSGPGKKVLHYPHFTKHWGTRSKWTSRSHYTSHWAGFWTPAILDSWALMRTTRRQPWW